KYLDAIEKLIGNKIDWLDGDLSTVSQDDAAEEAPRRGRGKGRERGRASEDGAQRSERRGREKPAREEAVAQPAAEAAEPAAEDRRSRKDAIKTGNTERAADRKGRPEREPRSR